MLLGVALVVLSSVLAFVAQGVTALAVVRGLQGLGFSAFFVANYSYVLDSCRSSAVDGRWHLRAVGDGVDGDRAALRRDGDPPLWLSPALRGVRGARAGHGAIVWTLAERERVDVPTVPPSRPSGPCSTTSGIATWPSRSSRLGSGTLFAFLPTFGEQIGVRTLALLLHRLRVRGHGRARGGRTLDRHARAARRHRALDVPAGRGVDCWPRWPS